MSKTILRLGNKATSAKPLGKTFVRVSSPRYDNTQAWAQIHMYYLLDSGNPKPRN